MTDQQFILEYQSIPNVSFPNAAGMKTYLQDEAQAWSVFLSEIESHIPSGKIQIDERNITASSLVAAFETLLGLLSERSRFNQATKRYARKLVLPPPSSSIEGQLILGLYENNRKEDAICVYIWFIIEGSSISHHYLESIGHMIARGTQLSIGAYAASALPFKKVTTQQMAGALRSAQAQVRSLEEEVLKARENNVERANALVSIKNNWYKRIRRISKILLQNEKDRHAEYVLLQEQVREELDESLKKAKGQLKLIDHKNENLQKFRQNEYEKLLELFYSKLRLEAPVQLWENRAKRHERKSRIAFYLFLGFSLAAVIAGILIPYCFGGYIADSFFTQICTGTETPTCTRDFSAKGPLTVAGILLTMSLLLWVIRLQYRVFLSERHLALDASEKQAFAETYLAIKEGKNADIETEAIVFGALFRPTQDGIIKDDATSFDPSLAAILAKQLGSK